MKRIPERTGSRYPGLIRAWLDLRGRAVAPTIGAGLLLVALLGGCVQDDSLDALPELPPVATDSFLPVVAEQLVSLQRAVEQEPDNASMNGRLGMAYLAYRENHAAAAALHRARLLEPEKFRWPYYHAEALTRLGRLDEAAAALQDANSISPGYDRARARLGLLYLQLGDPDRARDHLAAVVKDDPGNAEARFGLARLDQRAGQWDDARAHLERILDEVGGAGSVYFVLSEISRLEGDQERAAKYLMLFEQYRDVAIPVNDPLMGEVAAMDLSERPLLRAAARLTREGRDIEAIGLLEKALERNPGSHLTHAALVGAFGALRQFDKVEEHYRRAVATAPPTAPLLRNLGRARVYEGRLDEARQALLQALQLNPHDAAAMAWLGIVYLRQNSPEQGIAMLNRAAQEDPGESMARLILAEILLQQGRDEEALGYLRELQASDRNGTPRVWRLMGQAYLRLGMTDEARNALTNAVAGARRLDDDEEAQRSEALLQRISG